MYWNTNPATSNHLELLLNKKDVTLQEIMDDEGILQECKSQNKHLIDFLIRSENLEKLVALTTEEPSGDEEDTVKYKYSNIACELLTCEVPVLGESLANDESLLRKLYSFLDSEAPLNPLLASFFSKTLSVLITRKSEQNWYSYQITCLKVLEFLKLKENSITLLLKHLGTSAIMDLIFKLITEVEDSNMKENILSWLDEQKLVENLVKLLDPSVNSDMHYNAAQLLCDVIKTARTSEMIISQPNKILDRIESPEIISLLLDHILKEPRCDTSIVGGISVLLTLMEDKRDYGGPQYPYEEFPEENENYLRVIASTTQAILPRLKDFHDILINPPFKPAVKTTIAMLEPPLGNTRVEVAKLLSVLVASNKEEINKKLAELDTINVLLDLFFKYTWNNFLHTQVEKCLAFALNSKSPESNETGKQFFIVHILSNCRLIQRILEAWDDNETQQTEHKRPRRGYMGHLIEIANNIVQLSEKHSFGALMKEIVDSETLNKWEVFVTNKLVEIQKIYSTCLGESHSSSSDKNNDNGKESSFENFSQGLYSNYYQLQALAPAFTGEFGSFQEDQFNEDEDVTSDTVNSSFHKINFNVNEEENDQQAAFFEKVCAQKFQTLDECDDYAWNQDSSALRPNDTLKRDINNKSEEMDSFNKNLNLTKQEELDYNALSSWPADGDSLNPWESSNINTDASPDLGWADFESAPFVTDFETNLSSEISSTIASFSENIVNTAALELTSAEDNREDNKAKEILVEDNLEMEKPLIIDNSSSSIIYTDLEIITKAANKVTLDPDNKNLLKENNCTEENTDKNLDKEIFKIDIKGIQDSRFENPEIIGDVNSTAKLNKEKELTNDSRLFFKSQESITSSEKDSERGDLCQSLKENVQEVPKETAHTSCNEIGNIGSEDKSPNGPI